MTISKLMGLAQNALCKVNIDELCVCFMKRSKPYLTIHRFADLSKRFSIRL